MRSTVIRNNSVKNREAVCLNDFLSKLSRGGHKHFVDEVVARAGIERHTFFNWKFMCCRITDIGKEVIEEVAGRKIFDDVEND
jgi:hypothetical protein